MVARKIAARKTTSKTNTYTATFVLERETPGAIRYQEKHGNKLLTPSDPEALIGMFYVRKRIAGENPGKTCKVTVEFE